MKFYFVGGCVRDAILGKSPKDYDFLVVDGTEEKMLSAGFHKVDAGFPVFTSPSGDEFALARIERKNGSGYLGFSTECNGVTLEQDLARRDLTINAMAIPCPTPWTTKNSSAWNLKITSADIQNLVDPYGGLDDIQKKILRHVSPAFAEDPLRVLRVARFRARLGREWKVAEETVELCRAIVASGEMASIPRERFNKEFMECCEAGEKSLALFLGTLNMLGAGDYIHPKFSSTGFLPNYLVVGRTTIGRLLGLCIYLEDMESVEEFFDNIKLKNDYADACRIGIRLMVAMETTINPIEILYESGGLRNKKLLSAVLLSIKDFVGIETYDELQQAMQICDDYGFDHLDERIKLSLKGREISRAIKELRIEKYTQLK